MTKLYSDYALKISGKDAFTFIDSLISNKAVIEKYKGSYFLKPDGKIDYWFLVTLRSDVIYILQQKEILLLLKDSLEKYKIRINCDLEIIEEINVFELSNENDELSVKKINDKFENENWKSVCLELSLPTLEIIAGGIMPNEVNMLESFVDYYKGCFLGQEQTSRVKFRGKPRRILKTNENNTQEIIKLLN